MLVNQLINFTDCANITVSIKAHPVRKDGRNANQSRVYIARLKLIELTSIHIFLK